VHCPLPPSSPNHLNNCLPQAVERAERAAAQYQQLDAHSQDLQAELEHFNETNAHLQASYSDLRAEHNTLLAQVCVCVLRKLCLPLKCNKGFVLHELAYKYT